MDKEIKINSEEEAEILFRSLIKSHYSTKALSKSDYLTDRLFALLKLSMKDRSRIECEKRVSQEMALGLLFDAFYKGEAELLEKNKEKVFEAVTNTFSFHGTQWEEEIKKNYCK